MNRNFIGTYKFEDLTELKLNDKILLVLLLFGIYTGVNLHITASLVIPFVAGFIFLPFLIIKGYKVFEIKEFVFILALLVVSFFTLFFAPQPFKYFLERFKGFIHLTYSLIVCYYIFIYFRRFNPLIIAKIFKAITILIILGSLLENLLPPFRAISDAFRHFVFKQYIYESDLRDIILYGGLRPRLFTSEPSHVAKFFVLSEFIWFTLTIEKHKYIKLTIATLIALVSIRSPIIVLIFPLAFLSETYLTFRIRIIQELKKFYLSGIVRKVTIYVTFFVFFLIIISFISARTLLSVRLQQFIQGKDLSTLLRIVVPLVIGIKIVSQFPVFGVGITGKELLMDSIAKILKSYGFIVHDQENLANAFWNFWMYFGIIGGAFILFILYKFLKSLKIKSIIFIVGSVFIFSQTMGGVVTIRWWFACFMIFLITLYKDRHSLYTSPY